MTTTPPESMRMRENSPWRHVDTYSVPLYDPIELGEGGLTSRQNNAVVLNSNFPVTEAQLFEQGGQKVVVFPQTLNSEGLSCLLQLTAPNDCQHALGTIDDWQQMLSPEKDADTTWLAQRHSDFDPGQWKQLLQQHLPPLLRMYRQLHDVHPLIWNYSGYHEIANLKEWAHTAANAGNTEEAALHEKEWMKLLKTRGALDLYHNPDPTKPEWYQRHLYYGLTHGNAIDSWYLGSQPNRQFRIADRYNIVPILPLSDDGADYSALPALTDGSIVPFTRIDRDSNDRAALEHFQSMGFEQEMYPSVIAGLCIAALQTADFRERLWNSHRMRLHGVENDQQIQAAQLPFLLLHLQKHLRNGVFMQQFMSS